VMGRLDDSTPDQPFARFMRERCADVPEVAKAMARTYVEGFNAADENRISAKGLAEDQKAEEKIEGDKMFRLAGGYDGLVGAILHALPSDRCEVRLRSVVTEVRWRRGHVEAAVRPPQGE